MVHHALQIRLRAIEHAEVVEWASTTEPLAWNRHPRTGRLQHLERRAARGRGEIVVEGVGPENHFTSAPPVLLSRRRHICRARPFCEALKSEPGHLPLRRKVKRALHHGGHARKA